MLDASQAFGFPLRPVLLLFGIFVRLLSGVLLCSLTTTAIVDNKVFDLLRIFVRVAGRAGERQIRDAIGAPSGFGVDVVDLEGDLPGIAIGALTPTCRAGILGPHSRAGCPDDIRPR